MRWAILFLSATIKMNQFHLYVTLCTKHEPWSFILKSIGLQLIPSITLVYLSASLKYFSLRVPLIPNHLNFILVCKINWVLSYTIFFSSKFPSPSLKLLSYGFHWIPELPRRKKYLIWYVVLRKKLLVISVWNNCHLLCL